ncbi:penicillin acylase family protein [Sphingomonas sp.]|uniref:penicillin acylase family protein n=1 Tax=Sphingomonas sp. TaxID=28214 RepID=UPI003B3A16A5
MRTSSILLVAAAATLPLPASAVDRAPGERTSRVRIVRDSFGIAHVHGKTDADAVFGMAYAQAEDDFPRIEQNYLVALGRLAEVDGEKAVWQDLRQRLFLDLDDLRAQYRASPPWLKTLMEAWADGLNQYLASHRDVRPRILTHFEPWMALAFSEGSIGGDIESGVDLAQLRAFYGQIAPPSPAALAARDSEMTEPQGSNGIALGPSRTVNGYPLLWINPHTSFFFRAEQQVTSDEGLDVYGAATWGQFFVYQGFNRQLGWMHTTSRVDNIDEFAETVERRNGRLVYRYGRAWRPMRQQVVRLQVRSDDGHLKERVFTTLATHHGPVIRSENGRWIAVAMLNNPRAALEQSFLRTKATSLRAYQAVSERKANSTNNTLLAAADGSIAFLPPQFVPVRSARFDYTRPVDGSDPATDWKGLHRLNQLPQVIAPSTGYVMNTNNWPWSAAGSASPRAADYPRYMDQLGENPRGVHATILLSGTTRFSAQSLSKAAFDSFLPFFEEQIPLLLRGYDALPPRDPRRARLAAPIALLTSWDRRWALTSRPTSLAVHWGEALWASEGPKAKAANVPLFTWFRETMSDADRLAALGQAIDQMQKRWGSWQVEWGRINRFQRVSGAIHQNFDDAAPSLPIAFTSGNFGSLASFAVERQPGQRCFYGTSGNSFVAVVEFGPHPRAWAVSAGGESGNPSSSHFNDQVRRYADGDLRPIPLDEEDLRPFMANAYHPGDPRPSEAAAQPIPGASRCGAL